MSNMYENLVEPTRVFFGEKTSKIPLVNTLAVLEKYDKEVLEKIISLKNDFFKSKAYKYFEKNQDWAATKECAKNDFLKKYPNCCSELIELFWWSYSYCLWKDGGIG